jgi:hypothetical protein
MGTDGRTDGQRLTVIRRGREEERDKKGNKHEMSAITTTVHDHTALLEVGCIVRQCGATYAHTHIHTYTHKHPSSAVSKS